MQATTETTITANVSTINALIGWALKLAPLVGSAILFFITLYSNQATLLKHDAQIDARLAKTDDERNKNDRELVKHLSEIDAALTILRHDLDFYIATTAKK